MRALVTGAGGFCGGRLLLRLRAAGHTVATLGLRPAPLLGPEHRVLAGVDDRAGARRVLEEFRPDCLFHLAGTLGDAPAAAMRAVNVDFAAVLLDALADLGLGGCRMVFFGSAAEYGPVPAEELPIREDAPADPRTDYARSKLRQTELALAAAGRGQAVTVLRPFNVVGPGLKPQLALGRFAREIADIARGRQAPVVETGPLSGSRDFVDADDLAELALRLALAPAAAGRVVNVCSGRETPMRAALDMLLRLSGVAASVREAAPPPGAGHALRSVGSPALLLALAGPFAFRPLEDSLRAMLAFERSR